MSNDPILDHYQTQLDDRTHDYKTVAEQLRVTQDPTTRNTLTRQLEQIGQAMTDCEQKIRTHQQDRQRQRYQDALQTLVSLLDEHRDQLAMMMQAYQQTVSHWPVPVRATVETAAAMVGELEKIVPGQRAYTAQDEFIAQVVYHTSDPLLASALVRWGETYRSGVDWLHLYDQIQAQIQADYDRRLAQAQPAILITIVRRDEASTQADQPYYQLAAWVVEDIATYKTQKTGYHSLLSGADPAAVCQLEDITQRIDRILAEQRRICTRCEQYPEVHIFLPAELMALAVDSWPINQSTSSTQSPRRRTRIEYLGHDHVVILRCANRYDRTYTKGPRWLTLWRRHQGVLSAIAQEVLVPGHDQDLDELFNILEQAIQPESSIVGLQVSQVPVNPVELCYELLDSGLPLAIWMRQNLADQAHETQLAMLLASCCLERLPHTVQAKRQETRQRQYNASDCHIGHHLSLLRDDPDLVPPQSA